jgi:hypothetical protein
VTNPKLLSKEMVCNKLSRATMVLTVLAASTCFSETRTIETSNAVLRLDQKTCDLVGLSWKQPVLEVIAESRLGENFRLLLPNEGQEASYFQSKDQTVSRVEIQGSEITCTYNSLRNSQEELPVKVQYRIRSTGSQILFSIDIDNPTDRKLAEVLYGIVGGQQGIANRADTESLVPGGYSNQMPKMFTHYELGLNFGIPYENAAFTYPSGMNMGWIDIYNLKAGLGYYYANQDPEVRLTAFYTEMRPYTKGAVPGDNWPLLTELPKDEPLGVSMGWLCFPYISNGTFSAGPVAIQVHNGDWHEGSHIYRAWFDQHFKVTRSPSWLRSEMAWQSIILSNPEDHVNWRFKDLPKLAADAKKYGITTFEILGWDVGGIDRGYPQYQPDPRLGTHDEFQKALGEVKALGVHPLIFANINVADTATPLFKSRLSKLAIRGRWQPDWPQFGWGEGTISSRLGLTKSNMTLISPEHPEFHKLLMDQYLQLAKDGADGFQFDKVVLQDFLDFNPALPTSPDRAYARGAINMYRDVLDHGRRINPNLAIASENWFDRALPYVDISYMRLSGMDMSSTAMRYTFPEWTGTIFGEGPGDFDSMNNGMRYGLVWDLAPRHYTNSVDDPLTRPLSRYVQELIRIRSKYKDLLFLGRFNDTRDAKVTSSADLRYSVFTSRNAADTRRAAVIVNFGDKEETAEVQFPGLEDRGLVVSTPFEENRELPQSAAIAVGRHRCVVVVTK